MSGDVAVQSSTPQPVKSYSVSLLLQRKCSCGGSAGLTSECTECQSKRLVGKPLQTKLRVNEPGDEYEQEADRMAEQVMRMPDSKLNTEYSPLHGMPLVQRTVVDSQAGIGGVPDSVQGVLSSPGQPLDADTRAFFEPRFGHDFGNVRVHSNAVAEQSARELSARAYTVGSDIVFGAGAPAPRTHEGRRLIAHELTHVIQQQAGSASGRLIQRAQIPYGQITWADFKAPPPQTTNTPEGAGILSAFDIPSYSPVTSAKSTGKKCKVDKNRSTEVEATAAPDPVDLNKPEPYMDQDRSWALDRYTGNGNTYCRNEGIKCEGEFASIAAQARIACQQKTTECEAAFNRGSKSFGFGIGNETVQVTSKAECSTTLFTKCQELIVKGATVTVGSATVRTKGDCTTSFFKQCLASEIGERARLLKHEQGHFDITKVMANKAQASLKSKAATLPVKETGCGEDAARDAARKAYENNVGRVLQDLGKDWQTSKDKAQKDYDGETGHGAKAAEQKTWEGKIRGGLKNYDPIILPAVTPTTTKPVVTPAPAKPSDTPSRGAQPSLSGSSDQCSCCENTQHSDRRLQTKLRVNETSDEYEQEADRLADRVMQMSDQDIGVEDEYLPRTSEVQRNISGESHAIEAPSIVQDAIRSAGAPLDGATRAFFEPRFGHDFSNVRVHSDAAAQQSADEVSAHAYTVGNDLVFAAGRYAPRTPEGRRLLAHELMHVVQQGDGNKMASALQRSPVFPDDSCDSERVEAKITDYVAIALELVKRAVTLLSNPEEVAGPLRGFFHVDLTKPGHVGIALPMLRDNLAKLQAALEGPVNSYCETRPEYRTRTRDDEERGSRSRAFTRRDEETHKIILAEGVTYNRNIFRVTGLTLQRQVVNTIIHEYSHLAQIGHGELDPADFSNEHSTKVRGLTMFEALNNAESYMRFVRAVASVPRSTGSLKQPTAEPGAGADCGSLDQLLPPRFPQAEVADRPDLEAYYPRLQGKCFRLLRGGDDSCFGYCLHRAAGGDALSKGANIAIPPTIEEFDSAFAQYYEPIELDAVDAANPPGDAVLALFARGSTPTHTACRSDIEYEGAYLWESKVSPVFPLILHHLSDLEGGAAGDVVRLYKRRAVQEP